MNEFNFQQGSSPHPNTIDALLPSYQPDTISVSSWTVGFLDTVSSSMANSLSAPIIHPLLLCFFSQSAPEVHVSAGSDDYLQIGQRSRAPTAVSIDGQLNFPIYSLEDWLMQGNDEPTVTDSLYQTRGSMPTAAAPGSKRIAEASCIVVIARSTCRLRTSYHDEVVDTVVHVLGCSGEMKR